MMPMRMPGISSNKRVTVFLTLRRTWVRQGYMLPVVSKLKTTSTAGVDMIGAPGDGELLEGIMPRGWGEAMAVEGEGNEARGGCTASRCTSPSLASEASRPVRAGGHFAALNSAVISASVSLSLPLDSSITRAVPLGASHTR